MNNFFIIPLVVLVAAAAMICVGCTSHKGDGAAYLGDTNELAKLASPEGFTVTPTQANDIRTTRHGNSIATHHIYYSEDSYYICDAFFGSKERKAVTRGTRINGNTGAIYNNKTNSWEQ